jgi:hypothetical protein
MFVARPLLQGLQAFTAPPTPGSTLRGLGQGARRSPLSLVRGERGNLGPPPVSPEGEPLPGSVVRDGDGHLTRLYHGTQRVYPDFDMAKAGSGAGGDLYGPGIYMTDSPEVAAGMQGYVSANLPGGQGTLLAAEREGQTALRYRQIAREARQAGDTARADAFTEMAASSDANQARLLGDAQPNARPVYADLKRPFDIEGRVSADDLQQLLGQSVPWSHPITGEAAYKELLSRLGSKDAANARLQALGYDGITHLGGKGTHQVYIAFSPEQVYPSFNVDALPTRTPLRLR